MASLLSSEKYAVYYQKVGLLYKRPEIKASLEVILSIFTVTILILAAVRPTLTNIAILQKKITDQELVSKKADNKIGQLINAQKQLTAFRSSLGLFDAAVPEVFSYADSAKRLEYLAMTNGLALESLGFSGVALLDSGKAAGTWAGKVIKPTADNTLLDEIVFSVTGRPQGIVTFLKEVENMDRLVGINNISLAKQVGLSKAMDTLKASGQLTFYFYSSSKTP